jgi:methionyl-tRNA formyltransferase
MALRIVFMGSPTFAVPTLAEIIGAGHEVVAVYSQPPRPAGRGQAERLQPVHQSANDFGIACFTPKGLRGALAAEQMRAHNADVAVVVAYGIILPPTILDAPRFGCLNLHGSLLPRWRGAAPIQRAVMAGDTQTGVMVMQMEAGLDTGPVCMAEPLAIADDATAGSVHDALSRLGAGLMVRALSAIERGSLVAIAQATDGITYAHKIDKSESRIDFSANATAVHNHIRGLSPVPGAWFEIGARSQRERIKILRSIVVDVDGPPKVVEPSVVEPSVAKPGIVLDNSLTIACGQGAIRIVEAQRAGKRPMTAAELLRGFEIPKGTALN